MRRDLHGRSYSLVRPKETSILVQLTASTGLRRDFLLRSERLLLLIPLDWSLVLMGRHGEKKGK